MTTPTTITLPDERYENIFNAYDVVNANNDTYTFYNINNKIVLPADVDDSAFDYWTIPGRMPLTTISYRIYGTMHLWWLILVVNSITNPIKLIAPGSTIRTLKSEHVATVLNNIKNKK